MHDRLKLLLERALLLTLPHFIRAEDFVAERRHRQPTGGVHLEVGGNKRIGRQVLQRFFARIRVKE